MPSILSLNRKYSISTDEYGLDFDVYIPNPKARLQIDINVAKRLNGAKIESLPPMVHEYMVAIETLNLCITKYPNDLKDLKSWDEIEDLDFVDKVYTLFLEKQKLFEEELKKNRDTGRTVENRNDSGSIHNERIQNPSSGDSTSIGFGNGTKDVSIGSGSDSGGHEPNKKTDVLPSENQSGTKEEFKGIHSGNTLQSPATKRLFF